MEQPNSEIIIYQNPDGNIKIDVRLEEETVWLTQAKMALLFGKGRTTITGHIQNVFEEGELDEKVVSRDFRHTTASKKVKPLRGLGCVGFAASPCFTRSYSSLSPSGFYKPQKER